MTARYAWPGDVDLDIDLHDLKITSVVVDGRCVLVGARDGAGWWLQNGSRVEINDLVDFSIDLLLPHTSDTNFAVFVQKLEGWRDTATPLRFVGAPDRLGMLIEKPDSVLPIPRKPWPSTVDE